MVLNFVVSFVDFYEVVVGVVFMCSIPFIYFTNHLELEISTAIQNAS